MGGSISKGRGPQRSFEWSFHDTGRAYRHGKNSRAPEGVSVPGKQCGEPMGNQVVANGQDPVTVLCGVVKGGSLAA